MYSNRQGCAQQVLFESPCHKSFVVHLCNIPDLQLSCATGRAGIT